MGKSDVNADAARRYWAALAAKDGKGMAKCYAADARFRDEVFDLRGREPGAMWRMLFSGAQDLRITTHPLTVANHEATGIWEARYLFSATGRQVRNVIATTLTLRDGKIVQQRDRFSFWRWSGQALGVKGWIFGWTPLVRKAVRKQARGRLQKWMAKSRRAGP